MAEASHYPLVLCECDFYLRTDSVEITQVRVSLSFLPNKTDSVLQYQRQEVESEFFFSYL